MKTVRFGVLVLLGWLAGASVAAAGPYTEEGIDKDDPRIVAWASGYLNYEYAQSVDPGWRTPEAALGPATGDNFDVVSLGECPDMDCAPGRITLTFDVTIADGEGPDLVLYENGFVIAGNGLLFAELGFVEVSTDGETFARFPAVSLTAGPVGGYEGIDPTDVFNLVGKHPNAYGTALGTPFDLAHLADDPTVIDGLVDLEAIHYVRVVDVPGFGGYLDAEGRPIYDAHPTFGSGGLDLEAVGVINEDVPSDDDDAADDDDDVTDDDDDTADDDDDTADDDDDVTDDDAADDDSSGKDDAEVGDGDEDTNCGF